MELYAILRRDGWRSGTQLEQAADRSTKVGNKQMADDIRWICSFRRTGGIVFAMVTLLALLSPAAHATV